MKNRDMPANAAKIWKRKIDNLTVLEPCNGLSKREYAAIAAMQGMCTLEGHICGFDRFSKNASKVIAKQSVIQADALFNELEKDQ